MASSPEFVRIASAATRPLTEIAFEAMREAVLVVDTRPQHQPVILANATARRCLLADVEIGSLLDCPLGSLLDAAEPVMQLALGLQATGVPSAIRSLTWRLPGGDLSISTELKLLTSAVGQRMVMLTFAEPANEPELFSALEHVAPGLLILNKELTVTYANASAARTAGGMPGGILNISGLTLIPTLGIPRDALVNGLEGRHFHDEAISVAIPGAQTRWFEVDVQPLTDASGIAGLAILTNEVTERRSGKPASTAVERRLSALTEHATDIITVAAADGKLHYISGGIRNSLGYTAEERRSHSLFEHIHPEDVESVKAKYAQLVRGALTTFSHQFRIRHKDGTFRWLESNYVSALDNPLVNGVVVNSRDITDRRQAENRLSQREEVFRLAADAVKGIIFEWDLVRQTVHRSQGVEEVLGMAGEDLAQEGAWSARVHPLDVEEYERTTAAAVRSGGPWTATYRIRDSRGRYRSLLERGLVQRSDDGSPLRALGCCVDVSEIKRLTDLLAEAQRAAKMGAWEYNVASDELTWTEEMFRIYETSPTEFVVGWEAMFGRCTLDSRKRFDRAYRAVEMTGGGFDLELEITTLKGQRLWVRIIGHQEKLQGSPVRAYGSVQNIHAQKLAQIALENRTGWLKLSMKMANMHPWRWDRATDALEFAILDDQTAHLPRVLPGMKKLLARVHSGDRVTLKGAIDRAFETRKELQEEFRLKSQDGNYHTFGTVARPVFDTAGEPSGMVGVSLDVTSRHEAEARLRRSEELLRTTTANTADTLLLLDGDLRVCFINRDTPGMAIAQIIGEHVSVLLPASARDGVLTKLRQVLVTGDTATYEFDVHSDAEETQYYENRAVLVRDERMGLGISVTVRNITERKRLEQEILDVSSRERQTIGRDLHDGLGQELTGVALMLRALATRIRKQAPESVDQVNEIVALVNQSIETARALARGLLPVNQESGGLSLALRSLVDRSRELYGFEVDFWAEVSPHVVVSETSASHLYRIAQEALTNAARHGQASAVAVFLLVTTSRFLLQISDNGCGMGAQSGSASGMGLKIMKYRAGMIGATFEVDTNRPQGTVVRIIGEQPMLMSPLHYDHAI
jgi:PAS domain S-box-containing protein